MERKREVMEKQHGKEERSNGEITWEESRMKENAKWRNNWGKMAKYWRDNTREYEMKGQSSGRIGQS